MNVDQINLIFELISAAHAAGFPLWLESGWAVDARLGRVTREHDDIDLAIPAERIADFKTILGRIGTTDEEDTEYGFLVRVRDILLDCEPCRRVDGRDWASPGGFMPYRPGRCP